MGDKCDKTAAETAVKNSPLHPVYTVTNIQHKVRVLDGKKVSYSSWVKLFQLHAEGYEVLAHIDGTDRPSKDDPTYASWKKIDSIVLQWIYGTLDDDLLIRVLETESTALEAWNCIKRIFHNNKGPRVAALEQQFVNLKLRDTASIAEYCQRLKDIGTQLNDLDSKVDDQKLVLQMVRGLPAEYDITGALIIQQLPTWEDACNMLQADHDRQAAREPSPVVAATVQEDNPQQGRRPYSNNRSDPSRGGSRNGNHHGGSGHRNNSGQGTFRTGNQWGSQRHSHGSSNSQSRNFYPCPTNSGPAPSWPNYWNMPPPPPCPYPTQPGWAPPPWANPSHSPNGPNNNNYTHQSPNTNLGPTAQAHFTEYNALDPTDLSDAFSNMQATDKDDQVQHTAFTTMHAENMDALWHMDTGATTHVTGDAGFQDWEDHNEA
ncbi:uncharacterized protein LOC110892666 [Helianthus annuus]|uniref:uncharacterized protein LOC110892666 n=1 Tax=Helianthus annuus TaxID=4232 RepID=UPI000B902DC6|nr:uncharacterized protein LOC110892666 [Helianthus annuus]